MTRRMPKLGEAQAALYASEEVLHGRARRFTDIRQIRAYVDVLASSDWFQALWPEVHVIPVERRGSGATWSLSDHWGILWIARPGYDIATVLHEIAHVVAPTGDHGVLFAEALLTLVRHEMGFDAWAALYYTLRYTEPFQYVHEGVEQRIAERAASV